MVNFIGKCILPKSRTKYFYKPHIQEGEILIIKNGLNWKMLPVNVKESAYGKIIVEEYN